MRDSLGDTLATLIKETLGELDFRLWTSDSPMGDKSVDAPVISGKLDVLGPAPFEAPLVSGMGAPPGKAGNTPPSAAGWGTVEAIMAMIPMPG